MTKSRCSTGHMVNSSQLFFCDELTVHWTFVASWLQTWKGLDTSLSFINGALEQTAAMLWYLYIISSHQPRGQLVTQSYALQCLLTQEKTRWHS